VKFLSSSVKSRESDAHQLPFSELTLLNLEANTAVRYIFNFFGHNQNITIL